ncbi:type VI secretion system contractile sheath large subunit [Pseudophaeobacter sp.]|uniref:type VI secretion system contractile sheath domain-containing protein n=1 Tax=Pseudophaeobacter sp. TaxID=1971739 RepID=UPI0032986579
MPDLEGLETDTDAEIGAILEGLATQDTAPEPEEDLSDLLGELAAAAPAEGESEETDLSDILGSLDEIEPTSEGSRDLGEILADVAAPLPEETATDQTEEDLAEILGGLDLGGDPEISEDNLQDVLGDLVESESDTDAEDSAAIDLDDVLAGLDLADEEPEAEQDLADVLSGLAAETEPEDTSSEDDLDAVLAGVSLEEEPQEEEDLDSLLSGLGESPEEGEADGELEGLLAEASDEELDLDALLGGDAAEQGASSGDDALDLDDLLGDLGDDPAEDSGLDDLLAGLDEADDPEVPGLEASDDLSDLDDLLGDLGDEAPDSETAEGSAEDSPAEEKPAVAEPEFAYGTMAADRPDAQKLTRRRFRIALFGDFSGRTARGQVETGDALAARLAIVLDPDTVEEVIESFASELILPLCKDEAGGISVKLSEFDDLHPDELFENVALFSELVSLRKQLQSGVTVDHASRSLATWAAQYGTPLRVPKRSSPSNAVPADRRLSAFQQLIGDSENSLREASPLDEMLARIVGPHIRALPNPELAGMQEAVDAALSDAMRLVLHHPEFQSLEAQWRSLDLIARSVEVDDNLEVVLYDVSAEELAADLAAQDDLSVSGLTRLLTEEPMDPELGRGGYSALIGLYGFEEIPPHAELLGRIARVAAHVDAPFFTSLSPEFLKTAKKDRPPLVSQAWDTLQQMPEAGHLGLSSPRFLLRRPYGAKSDPVDVFEFEEFSEAEGLRGMLWGNPAVLVTILLARSFKENGASMQLGSIMSLGDMPFHTVIDRFGDQVALPCTERNIDLDKIAHANERGVMAVSAVKGRDELRLTSFSSVAGGEILGPWTGVPAPEPSPPDPREKAGIAVPKSEAPSVATEESDDLDLSDLGLDDLDLDDLGGGDDAEDDGLGDLDDLLAGFGDDDAGDDSDDDEMDEELAALLADL